MIHGLKICCQAPSVSHLLFVDDSYLFCKANESEALKMMDILQVFDEASRQQVNLVKSSVVFSSNIGRNERDKICQFLQMGEADGNATYLGLLNMVGRNKSSVFGYLKEKINHKVQSWKEKWFTQAGREILIKNLAQTMLTHAMSMFLLPLEITRDFERSLSRYWGVVKENGKSGIFRMN